MRAWSRRRRRRRAERERKRERGVWRLRAACHFLLGTDLAGKVKSHQERRRNTRLQPGALFVIIIQLISNWPFALMTGSLRTILPFSKIQK